MKWEGESPSLQFYQLKGFLPSHGMEWEELGFDDDVSYTQRENGLQHS